MENLRMETYANSGKNAMLGQNKNKLHEAVNWLCFIAFMIFYAGTWTFPWFYHVTEIYNSLIIFAVLAILFLNNFEWSWIRDKSLYILIFTGMLAFANLFIIGSNKGAILILADFLLIWYMTPKLRITSVQFRTLEIFFVLMFLSWFIYDRAFFYNANTGATVTVFTFFAALPLINSFIKKKEIYGFFLVLFMLRTLTLVLWHLARGAFIALALYLIFYYLVPKRWWDKRPWLACISIFSTLGSLVFVGFYVWLGSTGFNLKLPFFYKNIFSGREQIWLEVWDILKLKLITGIGSGVALKSFFEYNIHNAMYDILAVHGLLVFVLSLVLIIPRLLKISPKGDTRRLTATAGLFAIFIESFIDMDLMWADYSPILFFLLLEIYRESDTESPALNKGFQLLKVSALFPKAGAKT